MPGQRAADMILRAYLERNPAINWERNKQVQVRDVTIIEDEPLPVVLDAPQSGHPYRGGPPTPEPPKGPWRAAWAWLRAFLS